MTVSDSSIQKTKYFLGTKLDYVPNNREYYDSGKFGVDFSISRNGRPMILIIIVDDLKIKEDYWTRINDAFRQNFSRYAIMTDGDNFEFYTDLLVPHQLYKTPILTYDLEKNYTPNSGFLESFKRTNLKGETLRFGPTCDYDAINSKSPTGYSWRELEEKRMSWRRESLIRKGTLNITTEMLLSRKIPSYEQYFSIKPKERDTRPL